MSSFFGKFKGSVTSHSPNTSTSPSKKDHAGPPPTPLARLLEAAGPLREDGTDKFFGMENFGNTCYCNSILQCLYHSLPFRQQLVRETVGSPQPSLQSPPNGVPRLQLRTPTNLNGTFSPLSPTGRTNGPVLSPARRNMNVPTSPGPGGIRPEDKPDSAEYKKKQALMAGPVLTLDYNYAESPGMSESLFTCLKGIFEAMAAHPSRMGVVSPQRFLETLKRENEMYRGLSHQDAHEFFNLLLNQVIAGVEERSKKEKSDKAGPGLGLSAVALSSSAAVGPAMDARGDADDEAATRWVHDLFEGTLTSETKCLTCENTSSRDEPFLDLSVDLEHHSSVSSCLRKFSEEEMLCERNKFHCDNCGGLQEAEKRMKIKRLPRILALHLKRFKYEDQDHQQLQKLFHRVVYPYHLRLFNTTDDAEDPDRLYELYAVVVHIGAGPLQGHYVSVIKTPNRGWLLFDDELVEPVDKSYVWNFFGGKPGAACAYVLFYQETTIEAVEKEQEAEALAATLKNTTTPTSAGAPSNPKLAAAASPVASKPPTRRRWILGQ